MRVYKTFEIREDIPIIFTCNKCGFTMNCEKDEIEEWMTDIIHPLRVDFWYGEDNDGKTYTFDLCSKCIKEIVKDFVVPVEIENYL